MSPSTINDPRSTSIGAATLRNRARAAPAAEPSAVGARNTTAVANGLRSSSHPAELPTHPGELIKRAPSQARSLAGVSIALTASLQIFLCCKIGTARWAAGVTHGETDGRRLCCIGSRWQGWPARLGLGDWCQRRCAGTGWGAAATRLAGRKGSPNDARRRFWQAASPWWMSLAGTRAATTSPGSRAGQGRAGRGGSACQIWGRCSAREHRRPAGQWPSRGRAPDARSSS